MDRTKEKEEVVILVILTRSMQLTSYKVGNRSEKGVVILIPRLNWHRKAGQHGTTRYGAHKFASVNKRQGVPNRAVLA